jgi:hypothetical protein
MRDTGALCSLELDNREPLFLVIPGEAEAKGETEEFDSLRVRPLDSCSSSSDSLNAPGWDPDNLYCAEVLGLKTVPGLIRLAATTLMATLAE